MQYQPVFAPASGALHGVEALLRWDHPDLGSVSPAEFIPLAEQSGGIHALGDFVVEHSLARLAAWGAAFPDHRLRIGVNVSPHQLSEQAFVTRVLGLLATYRLDPSQLVVEITEQAFVSDLEPMAAVARTLRSAGVSIAVDDFGTDYASLRYLESIPTDILKIDRAYISAIPHSPGVLALVRGVLALAASSGCRRSARASRPPSSSRCCATSGATSSRGTCWPGRTARMQSARCSPSSRRARQGRLAESSCRSLASPVRRVP